MAKAVTTTRPARTKSTHDYTGHILRYWFVQSLQHIDTAVTAERSLADAAAGQPDGIWSRVAGTNLRDAELAWDHVADCLSAASDTAGNASSACVLQQMTFALRAVLASESPAEFGKELAAARHLITDARILPDASIAERDFHHVVQTVAARLDALDSLDLYRSGMSDDGPDWP